MKALNALKPKGCVVYVTKKCHRNTAKKEAANTLQPEQPELVVG